MHGSGMQRFRVVSHEKLDRGHFTHLYLSSSTFLKSKDCECLGERGGKMTQ